MSLTAKFDASLVVHEHRDSGLSEILRVTDYAYSLPLTDGTGASQAQVCWGKTATVGTNAITYDMRSLSDDRGNVTVTSTKVCYVRNLSETTHLELGGVAGPTSYPCFPAAGSVTVHEDGIFQLAAGDAGGYASSADGSGCSARFRATAGTVAFQVVIVGEGSLP